MLVVQARELGLDQLQPFRAYDIVRGDRPVGQVVIDLPAFGLLGKGLAHGGTIPCLMLGLWCICHLRNCGQLRLNQASSACLIQPQLPTVAAVADAPQSKHEAWYGAPMSKAFTKEAEGGEVYDDLPDRPVSPHNVVSPVSYTHLT